MTFFTGAGNWIVIQYGSLQSIPDDVLEAARIDGANAFQIAFLIKLPLIRKYLIYMLILVMAAGLQIFVEPYLISSSVYPGIAKDWSLNQLGYTLAFLGSNLGAATALSLMLLLVMVVLALIVIFRTDFFDEAKTKIKEV
jgi:multiple sugar transport system permease protein